MEGELNIGFRVAIDVDNKEFSEALMKLLHTVENLISDTDDFYANTNNVIIRMLDESIDKIKDKRKRDPFKDPSDEELALLKSRLPDIWKDLVSMRVKKDYIPPLPYPQYSR